MNIVEKILSRASGKSRWFDDAVFAKVDKAMVHDVSGQESLRYLIN